MNVMTECHMVYNGVGWKIAGCRTRRMLEDLFEDAELKRIKEADYDLNVNEARVVVVLVVSTDLGKFLRFACQLSIEFALHVSYRSTGPEHVVPLSSTS